MSSVKSYATFGEEHFTDDSSDDEMAQNNGEVDQVGNSNDLFANFARSTSFVQKVSKQNDMADFSTSGRQRELQKYFKTKGIDKKTRELFVQYNREDLLKLSLEDLNSISDQGARIYGIIRSENLAVDTFRFQQAAKSVDVASVTCTDDNAGVHPCTLKAHADCSKCEASLCVKHTRKSLWTGKSYCESCYKRIPTGKVDQATSQNGCIIS